MDKINLAVPYFSQRDIMYRWQNNENNNDFYYIAAVSCNITSLCMILNYLGITDDTPEDLAERVFDKFKNWNNTNGYDSLTSWYNLRQIPSDIYEIEKKYILDLQNKNIEQVTEKLLNNGYPIMFSIGTLNNYGNSTTGHIVVLRGFLDKSYFIVNDPWGQPTNPYGLLNKNTQNLRGYYTARTEYADIIFGKGNGDNTILTYTAFMESTGQDNEDKKHFNGAAAIIYPYIYKFPLEQIKINLENNYSDKIYSSCCNESSYLLGENGKLLSGLEIRNQNHKNVYSIGAGRVLAIKNTENVKENFILVQYKVPGESNSFFYVNYKKLQYIDIQKEIKNSLYQTNSFSNGIIEQLIKKILPKKGIYDKGTITGGKHPFLDVPERGFVNFYPNNQELENYIFDIFNDNKSAYEINDIDNYKIQNNYLVYEKNQIKQIPVTNIIPQSINYKEYIYYRKKLKQIAKGEIVFFFDENDFNLTFNENLVNKNNYQQYFISAIKDIFHEISFDNVEYHNALIKVQEYYTQKISSKETNSEIQTLKIEFESKCKLLCKTLLEMPWEEQEWAFTLNDKWYKGDTIGKFVSLHDIYINLETLFIEIEHQIESKEKVKQNWEKFNEEINLFYPSNVDYFLEVSSNSLLGKCSEKVEFDCFSEKKLIDAEEIEFDFFSKNKVINEIVKNKILDTSDFTVENNYLTEDDVKRLNIDKRDEFRNIIIRKKNYFYNKYERKFLDKLQQQYGFTMLDDSYQENIFFNIFPKMLTNMLKKVFNFNNRKNFYYYNLITILEKIILKQEEICKELETL